MATRIPLGSEWNLNLDFDGARLGAVERGELGGNVVPFRTIGRGVGPMTQRGAPRVLSPTDPSLRKKLPAAIGGTERPLVRTPPGVSRVPYPLPYPLTDPQTEATLEFDAATLQRRPGLRRKPATHADLDLQRAFPDRSSPDLRHARPRAASSWARWHTWLAFVVGAAGSAAVLVALMR